MKFNELFTMKYKIKTIIQAALVAPFFGSCTQQSAKVTEAPSFIATLDVHLQAIKERSIEKLEPTVAESVSVISPDGKKSDGKKEFMDFHKNWFAQPNWERDAHVVSTDVSDSIGYAIIQYEYIQKDTVGNILIQHHDYMVLIFKNFGKGWQLVHDQNTGIQELNKK